MTFRFFVIVDAYEQNLSRKTNLISSRVPPLDNDLDDFVTFQLAFRGPNVRFGGISEILPPQSPFQRCGHILLRLCAGFGQKLFSSDHE